MTDPNLARWPAVTRSPLCSQRRLDARWFQCALCGTLVGICRACDRGHKYCSPECRREVRLAAQREASQCYQSTEVGRAKHAERSARYRRRQQQERTTEGGVTQQGLVFPGRDCRLSPAPECCVECCVALRDRHRAAARRARSRRSGRFDARHRTGFLDQALDVGGGFPRTEEHHGIGVSSA
jgi:hypothetical protein